MDWYRKYREEAHWLAWYRREFDTTSRRIFDDPEDARATAIYRMLYEKLPASEPRNRDHLDAFVRTMFRNLVRDMIRERAGRPRPPAKMQLLGEPITNIFYKFCLERKPVEVIAAELALPELSVQEWVTWLRANRKCPERTATVSLVAMSGRHRCDEFELPSDERDDPVAADVESEQMVGIGEWLLEMTASVDERASGAQAQTGVALRVRLREMRCALSELLSDEERVILGLRYREELSTEAISAATGLPAHTVRRREKAVLGRLRTFFVVHGLDG